MRRAHRMHVDAPVLRQPAAGPGMIQMDMRQQHVGHSGEGKTVRRQAGLRAACVEPGRFPPIQRHAHAGSNMQQCLGKSQEVQMKGMDESSFSFYHSAALFPINI
jgi:hypothetical protein